MVNEKHKITSWQFIALGYLVVILMGTFLLALPFSSKSGHWTSFLDSIFTATSATCVTGLVVYDTYTYWSVFGQIIILLLIQIGGLGFMTVVTLFAMLVKRQIGLYERKVIMQSAGSLGLSGVIRLIKRILIGTFIFEGVGTVLLCFSFCPLMGFGKGLYYALFHSVSAFCNAGFDLMGIYGQFSSFTNFTGDVIVNLTLSVLIFIGGLGFLVWSDIIDTKLNFKKFQLQTKVALIASIVLITVSAVLFCVFEKDNLFKNMNPGEAILASLFQSITPRTAGFNTIDLSKLSNSSTLLTIFIMFVGGCSGSTAGGIKINTFVVILLGIFSVARNNEYINIGKKRLDSNILHMALAISASYLLLICVGSLAITAVEPFGFKEIIFEVVSAIGTVGLSMGITPGLSVFSKLIIMLLMFIGKVGIITIALAFSEKHTNPPVKNPIDKILIG